MTSEQEIEVFLFKKMQLTILQVYPKFVMKVFVLSSRCSVAETEIAKYIHIKII